jgi:hypothetical protein
MLDSGSKSREVLQKIGGASRDRTDDLIVANDALSHDSPLIYQQLPAKTQSKTGCFLGRIWDVSRHNAHRRFAYKSTKCPMREEVIEGQMTKGEKVYVVENYLVEERTASLLAGEVGVDVIFDCHAGPRVHVTDHNGTFWEIPITAVCKVPEGHLSDLYQEPCLACGLRLFLRPEEFRRDADDVIRPYQPPINDRWPL